MLVWVWFFEKKIEQKAENNPTIQHLQEHFVGYCRSALLGDFALVFQRENSSFAMEWEQPREGEATTPRVFVTTAGAGSEQPHIPDFLFQIPLCHRRTLQVTVAMPHLPSQPRWGSASLQDAQIEDGVLGIIEIPTP